MDCLLKKNICKSAATRDVCLLFIFLRSYSFKVGNQEKPSIAVLSSDKSKIAESAKSNKDARMKKSANFLQPGVSDEEP